MSLYRIMLRIPWTKNVNNESVLKKIGMKRILVLKLKNDKNQKFLETFTEERGLEVYNAHGTVITVDKFLFRQVTNIRSFRQEENYFF